MSKVVVMDHPLIEQKIGIIRRKETGTKDFRQNISEIAMLIGIIQALKDGDTTVNDLILPIRETKKDVDQKKEAMRQSKGKNKRTCHEQVLILYQRRAGGAFIKLPYRLLELQQGSLFLPEREGVRETGDLPGKIQIILQHGSG